MNIYEHWSRRPIRRGMPIGDDRQAPDWRRYNREELQRRTHIHAQTQDHMEQTAECCHRRITTNRHMIYLETSNRIHPIQGGGFILPCVPFLSFFFHLWELLTGAPIHTEGTDTKTHQNKKDNPHLFPLHHSCIEPTPSQHIDFIFWSVKSPELPNYEQNSISRYYHTYTKKLV